MDGNSDLAVGLLAQCSAILSLNANGVFTLLGEGDVIEEEDAPGAGKGFGQVRAVSLEDLVLVPGTLVDELLEGLFGILGSKPFGKVDAMREWLDGFPLAIEDQSLQVDPGPPSGLGLRKVLGKHSRVITQPIQHSLVERRSIGFHVTLEARTLWGDSDL
jgi:hypothetical protein